MSTAKSPAKTDRTTGIKGVEIHRGKIRISFMHAGERCRETFPDLKPTAAGLKEAARLREEILSRIDFGTYRVADYFPDSPRAQQSMTRNDTLSEWAKVWLESVAPTVAKSTLKAYTSAVNFWTRKIGKKLLRDVLPIHIQSAFSIDAPKSGKTKNNYLSVLNCMFDSAFVNRLIDSRPTDHIANFPYQAPEPDPFTKSEVESVLKYMSNTYNDQVQHYFEFALMTGIRPSELIALEWSDVDFGRKTITVRRAHVASETKGTKTGLVRNVLLNDRALAVLQRQKQHTFMSGKEIFHNPVTMQAWSDDKQQREKYFAPTLKALGLRGRDAYQCRHTYATLLLTAGVHVGYISKQLGHTTIKTTLDRYARFLPDAYAAETEKANAVFAPALSPKIEKSA